MRKNRSNRLFTTILSRNIAAALLLCFILVPAGCRSIRSYTTTLPEIIDAQYVGSEICATCHNSIYAEHLKSIHHRISSNGVHDCESCHGPGSRHIDEIDPQSTIYSFEHLSADQRSQICLECHRGAPVMSWQTSRHLLNDIGCNDCHKAHKVSAPRMVHLGDPEICLTCHQDKKIRLMLPSHHPLREGKMQCGSCHDNHGSETSSLKAGTVNEVCAGCHAQYQGPFVFSHAPVVEDCSICHDPHGTTADMLLKQDQPFLCLRCHRGHSGNLDTGPHPSGAALYTTCTQCHSMVHGSDLPAQINGNSLTR